MSSSQEAASQIGSVIWVVGLLFAGGFAVPGWITNRETDSTRLAFRVGAFLALIASWLGGALASWGSWWAWSFQVLMAAYGLYRLEDNWKLLEAARRNERSSRNRSVR